MPLKLEWLVENRVLFNQGVGEITEAEFASFTQQLKTIFEAAPETRIHMIQDGRLITKPYSDLSKLGSFLGFMRNNFKGWYLVLDRPGNRFFGMLSSLVGQILGLRMRPPFTTYADLRAFLMEQDADLVLPETLPDLFDGVEPAQLDKAV